MNAITKKPKQLSLTLALAALAIGALVAVALTAGGNPAQATAATPPAPDGGVVHERPQQTDPTPTPTPRHAAPEACPGEDGNTHTEAAKVVSTGHIALFDVFWDADEEELANNPCPPTVVHVPEGPATELNPNGTPARDDRTPYQINIEETIIHIPNSAKVTLNETDYPNEEGKYADLWTAYEEGNPDSSGTPQVWKLPACPDGALTDSLCISVSADLLNPEDWGKAVDGVQDGENAPGPVQFLLDHAHQHDVGEQGARYVLAYHVADAGSNPLLWDTFDADLNSIEVAPDGYENPTWFFTRAGTYEFQVHVQGYPEHDRSDELEPVSVNDSVTSDVREYYVHVGLLVDLSVDIAAVPDTDGDSNGDGNLDPGDDVTITVTAQNDGPDTAPNTEVDVSLPDGLEYSEHTTDTTDTIECPDPNGGAPTQETYCSGTGVWAVGDLPNGDTKTLTITTKVAEGTRGQEQTVTIDISATEDPNSDDPPGLDPWGADNTATATITPHANTDPNFFIGLSVPENATHDTHVGSQISVNEPDSDDTLHYNLEGAGAGNFHVSTVDGGVQLKVARDAVLDLDRTSEVLNLTLNVRDDEDSAGNTSTAVDDTITVRILLEEDSTGFNALAEATAPVTDATDSTKSKATFTVTAKRLPSGSLGSASKDALRIRVVEKATGAASGEEIDLSSRNWSQTIAQQNDGDASLTWDITKEDGSGSYEYTVDVWVVEGSPEATLATAAAPVFTVTW